jgi:hypothetical protein
MASLDIFNNDAFSVSQLTDTIIDIPRVPTKLGDMGLFTESGISTLTFMIERKGSELNLVPTSPRGGVGQTTKDRNRKLIPLATVHLQENDAIMADVVQGVRAFGSETEVETIQSVVRERLDLLKQNIDLTLEWHRLGALKGKVLDADGSSVILDVYDAFGMTKTQQAWNIETPATSIDPVELTYNLKRTIRNKLGGRGFSGVRVECNNDFLRNFMRHNKLKEAYALWRDGAYLRSDNSGSDFVFNDVVFSTYDYDLGGSPVIAAGYAYAYPMGVPGMFQTVYSPADYMETVNTRGVPYYAKQEGMPFGKGRNLEAQSNPLCYNKFPEAVIELFHGSAMP